MTGPPLGGGEPTGFLYPFIDATEDDEETLLGALATSAAAKMADSAAWRDRCLAALEGDLRRVATAMSERLRLGGRVLCMGNGGSATDAAMAAGLFSSPPSGRPLPARALVGNVAVVTALANDVGYDNVFSRQVIAGGQPADTLVGFSTSGNSPNLLLAFVEAHRRGMLTVGLAGHDGGQMATSPEVDCCLVVPAHSVHRVQETQAALTVALWAFVQAELPVEPSPVPDRAGSCPAPGGAPATGRPSGAP